jgi:hypothetical protein
VRSHKSAIGAWGWPTGDPVRFLIRHLNADITSSFDEIFKPEGICIIRTPGEGTSSHFLR